MNNKAFSLLEILIAAVIMAAVIGGFAAIFVSSKQGIIHNRSMIVSAQLGKLFVDYLQTHVRWSDWDTSTNGLSVGTRYCDGSVNPQEPGCPSAGDRTLDGIVYNATYTVNSPYTNIRKVITSVNWNEPHP